MKHNTAIPGHLRCGGSARVFPAWAMTLLAAALTSTSAGVMGQGNVLESAELIVERDVDWLEGSGIDEVENGVAVYKLTYHTPNTQGANSLATAAFVMPQTECQVPLVAFIHGTMFLRSDAPSDWDDDAGSKPQGYTFGASGMACVMPDLLGLGESPGRHPYLNARVNARTTLDAIRAAREFQEQQGAPLNDQLFLMGSSAGSHTGLATARMIEEEHAGEFQLAATAGVNGPYAVNPVLRDIMLEDQVNNGGANLVYMLLGYQAAYPTLFASTASFLVNPYRTTLPPLFNGMHPVSEIISQLPPVPADMIPAQLRQELSTQPNSPLNVKLRENNVFNWAPQSPVRLCYCSSDHMVPPENSLMAYDSLTAHGGTQVELLEMSSSASHGVCGDLGRQNVTDWFRNLKVACNDAVGVADGPGGTGTVTISPNPLSSGQLRVQLAGIRPTAEGAVHLALVDAQGRTVQEQTGQTTSTRFEALMDVPPTLGSGLYSVVVTMAGQRSAERLLLVR